MTKFSYLKHSQTPENSTILETEKKKIISIHFQNYDEATIIKYQGRLQFRVILEMNLGNTIG